MTRAEAIASLAQLKAKLESLGWRTQANFLDETTNICYWYAWLPRRPKDWANCSSNEKPPSLCMYPAAFSHQGGVYSGVEFELCGELHGRWHKMRMYSVKLEEAVDAIPEAIAYLGAAWNAISQTAKPAG